MSEDKNFDFREYLEKSIGNDRDRKTNTYGKDINTLVNTKPKTDKDRKKEK